MRRLQLASLRCIVAFTRNLSWLRVLESVDTSQTPEKAERFRVFHENLLPNANEFAWFRTSSSSGGNVPTPTPTPPTPTPTSTSSSTGGSGPTPTPTPTPSPTPTP